jgi:hypothetical protein
MMMLVPCHSNHAERYHITRRANLPKDTLDDKRVSADEIAVARLFKIHEMISKATDKCIRTSKYPYLGLRSTRGHDNGVDGSPSI